MNGKIFSFEILLGTKRYPDYEGDKTLKGFVNVDEEAVVGLKNIEGKDTEVRFVEGIAGDDSVVSGKHISYKNSGCVEVDYCVTQPDGGYKELKHVFGDDNGKWYDDIMFADNSPDEFYEVVQFEEIIDPKEIERIREQINKRFEQSFSKKRELQIDAKQYYKSQQIPTI